jgi:hypothetical protein
MLGFLPLSSAPIADDGLIVEDLVLVTGVEAAGAAGSVFVLETLTAPTGVQAVGAAGEVVIDDVALVELSGLAAAGETGWVRIWDRIAPNVGTSYTEVDPSTSNIWVEVAA